VKEREKYRILTNLFWSFIVLLSEGDTKRFESHPYEEVSAEFFIRTDGICEWTPLLLQERIAALRCELAEEEEKLERLQEECDHIFGPEQQDLLGYYATCMECGYRKDLGTE